MKECAWCSSYFSADVSYQIYCSAECRKTATKEKIRDRSRIAVIKRRSKKKRMCINNCGTQLSVYNDDKVCNRCKVNDKLVNKALNNMKDFFDYEDDK